LLDVNKVYLAYDNGTAIITDADQIGSYAKKKIVNGMEVIHLCADGIHRVVWESASTGFLC
jgi:hypothetical protein